MPRKLEDILCSLPPTRRSRVEERMAELIAEEYVQEMTLEQKKLELIDTWIAKFQNVVKAIESKQKISWSDTLVIGATESQIEDLIAQREELLTQHPDLSADSGERS